MSSSSCYGWQNLPDLIFSDLMKIVGLDSIVDIHKCRQICQSWNAMISEMTKHKKDAIQRNAESSKIRKRWAGRRHPQIPEISLAARLAHHGLLGNLLYMRLMNVDLFSVPAEHLASLASCETLFSCIRNVSNCDMISILDNLKCKELYISSQTLSSEETRALVRAMESRVERVILGSTFKGEWSLDIRALTRYSGQGRCKNLIIWDSGDRYLEEVRSWAQKQDWDIRHITHENDGNIVNINIERKQKDIPRA